METIRLSQQAKEQLSRLKKFTKIQYWNVLCRWGFCVSLREKSPPPPARIPADSSVEMTWKVFAGPYQDVYLGLLKARCERDGLGTSQDALDSQFRLHLHRGIAYLAGDRRLRDIEALLRMAHESGRPDRAAELVTNEA